MTTATPTRPVLEPSAAARLEKLAARRDRRPVRANDTSSLPPPSPRPSDGQIDRVLEARLEKLAAARNGSGRGQVPPTARTNAPAKKRRHPAKHSRAAALSLSVLASGGLTYLFAITDQGVSASPLAPAGIVTSPATATPAASPSQLAAAPDTAQPAAATPATPETSSSGADSAAPADVAPAAPTTINGASFGTKWGDVQVQALFAADGTLADVTVLQVPKSDTKSVRINARAVPVLTSEALSAQSADIDTVSGATYTSAGYRNSLQSAIDIAIANGLTTIAATT